MKKFLTLFLLVQSLAVFGQSYRISVETYVSNKLEDKFSFTLSEGKEQQKGFDGKLLSKRYRAQGFPHKGLLEKLAIEKEEKIAKRTAAMKPAERVKKMLDKARKALESAETRMTTVSGQKDSAEQKVKELEELESLATRGSSSFQSAYADYLKRNGLTAEDAKVEKLFRKRPRDTGDVEEIDIGSFCNMKILKASDKKVKVSMDYAYSRVMSYFYSDGNNNGNTITKHAIAERFEKLGVEDLILTVGKQYCYQFTRLTTEKARSLSEAMAQSGIFGGGSDEGGKQTTAESPEDKALDAEGDYKEIKRKYASSSGKVVRVVISLRFDN